MQQLSPPPHDLAALSCWLVWRLVYVEGQPKPRKVPYYVNGAARQGTQGTEEDRAQLVTYEHAVATLNGSHGYYSGVGFALQPDAGIVALDFDDCVVDGAIAKHVEALCEGTYTEFSPSGSGVRAFFSGTLMSRKDVDAKRGAFPIEVFGHNGFVTFTGNVTETCALFGYDTTLAPLTPAVLAMYRERGWDDAQGPQSVPDDMRALALLSPTLPISEGEVAEYLQKLPVDLDYDTWIKAGMAVHQQTFASDAGFDIWHRWSTQSAKYTTEEYCRARWVSFGQFAGGAHITFAWVVKQANEYEQRKGIDARNELSAKVKECSDEFALKTRIAREIAQDVRLDAPARETLAKALQAQFKGLGGVYSITECRRMVAPPKAEAQEAGDDQVAPDWLDGYVWVNDNDKFYHCGRGLWSSQQSFNAAYNRHMPRGDGAAATVLKSAAATALEDYHMQIVGRSMYLPWANSKGTGVFDYDGVSYVNTFRAASVPMAVSQLDECGLAAINTFKRHLRMLCGGREEIVEHIINWMAHNVQKPGVKVRHAILIKGIEGDGKSLLGSMLAQVMGQSNVKQISPTVLATDFSDWAFGACIGALEEIRMVGHNRHDIYNRMKPMITNDVIPVHPKGKAEINVANTMNYLAFTNHNDALPLSDTDRRWMIIFTRFTTREALEATLCELEPSGSTAYWDKLHAAINLQPAALRRWLLDHRIPATFNPNGNAPMTEEKLQMQNMSASPEEELVREVLAEGAAGVGSNILSSTSLLDACTLADSEVSIQTTTINRILTRLGWVKMPKRVKWQARVHRVWVRGQAPESIQNALDKTATGESAAEKMSSETGFEKVPSSTPDEVDLFA